MLAVNICAPPGATVAVGGETEIAMPSCNVTMAEARSWGFAWLIAVTVTLAGLGMTVGAVYSPVPEIVPKIEFPATTPFTSQIMVVFAEPEATA